MSQICVGVHPPQQPRLSDAQKLRSSGSISWRSKSSALVLLFWRIRRRLCRRTCKTLRSFPWQRGLKAAAAPGLTFLSVPESHRCVVNTRSGRWACLPLFMCWNRCFIYSYFTAWLSIRFQVVQRAGQPTNEYCEMCGKWWIWVVGGGIEDFSSCCAACVEFVRNPSKQDCNCGELCSSILLSSGLELLPGRIPSSTFWSCLDDRSFHQSHLQSPRKYFCYFFLQLLLLDWRLQAVAAWLDW